MTKKVKDGIIRLIAYIICAIPLILYIFNKVNKFWVMVILLIEIRILHVLFNFLWARVDYIKSLLKSNNLKYKLSTYYQEVEIDFKNSSEELEELEGKKVFARVHNLDGCVIEIQNFSKQFDFNSNEIVFLNVKTAKQLFLGT